MSEPTKPSAEAWEIAGQLFRDEKNRYEVALALDRFCADRVQEERLRCADIAREAAIVDAGQPTDRITRASRAGSIAAAIEREEPPHD